MTVFYDGVEVGNFYNKTKGEVIAKLITKVGEDKKPLYPDITKYSFKSTVDEKYKEVTDYIFRHYDQAKQNSDISDKFYYEAILKGKGIEDVDAQLVAAVNDFYAGKTVEEIIDAIEDEDKVPYEQLLKLGIRVAWVQNCKAEYFAAKEEDRELDLPKFPL